MPKRSNPFQRLVKIIERQLWPEAQLSESAKIGGREIDILIEHKAGGTDFRIAVECRDRKRKESIEWIDDLLGKYSRDPGQEVVPAAHKVIAVSSSGFSEKAHRKAEESDLGIELLTLKEAEKVEWGKFKLLSEEVTVRKITVIPSTKIGLTTPPADLSTKLRLMEEGTPGADQIFLSGAEQKSVTEYALELINDRSSEPHVMREVASKLERTDRRLHQGKGFMSLKVPLRNKNVELGDNRGGSYALRSVTYHFAYIVNEEQLSLMETAYRDVRTFSDSDNLFDVDFSVALVEKNTEQGVRFSVAFVDGRGNEYLLETEELPFVEASLSLFLFAVADAQHFEPPATHSDTPEILTD